MIRLLTSNFKHYHKEGNQKIANAFDNTNGIVDQIKEYLKGKNTILFISSDSKNMEKVLLYSQLLFDGLRLSGIEFKNYLILSDVTKAHAKEYIEEADLIFLSGGDTFIQHQFFSEIKLKDLLINFNGLVIGQSAGALNMADSVFNSPEEMENSEPIYFNGLGLTKINIEPHFVFDTKEFDESKVYQKNKIIEESYKRKIYGQCDGSYILIDDNDNEIIYGETYLIENGNVIKICDNMENIIINKLSSIHK